MTDPRISSGASAEIKIATAIAGLIAQLIAGAIFIAGGGWIVYWALIHEQHKFVYVGLGVAVFGAWILPTIFTLVKNIYITVFPNGLPLLGGRRAGDPPLPPTEPPTP